MTVIVPVRNRRDVAAEYRSFAKAKDLSALNGRFGYDRRTEAMMALIQQHMDFPPSCRVLDIGCGDARLLKALSHTASRTGTVLTTDEQCRLTAEKSLSDIEFHAGAFEDLPATLGNRQFDRIIVNGPLPTTGSADAAMRALRVVSGFLAPGGQVWLGELFSRSNPQAEKFAQHYRSKQHALLQVWRRHGSRFALGFARHLLRHWRRADLIVEIMRPWGPWWYVKPSEMPALAERLGLTVEGIWDCEADWGCEAETGASYHDSFGRFSALLSKPGAA